MMQNNDLTREFESWWINQNTMFGNTLKAMYAFCEETGYNFDDLYGMMFNNKEIMQ